MARVRTQDLTRRHIGHMAQVTSTNGSTATGTIERIEHFASGVANTSSSTSVTLRVVRQQLEISGPGFEEIVILD
ncbi:hypothetical protein IGS67_11905 [Flavimobilis sp. GY10621]|uniref:TRAM domain-containing protein n=1 Tax=Flavimobilis rhizosphaerae TaxID=2775421 RepID=A0ABR9DTC0_9MICO|nr:hypothetical protein [Flavimobilis rhizosphaerae]MBD9700184.1 hypothetical protein [Flavimobilis rhizosphaerae]